VSRGMSPSPLARHQTRCGAARASHPALGLAWTRRANRSRHDYSHSLAATAPS
jgi:hypothetical protein